MTETLHDLVDADARHDYDPEPDTTRPTRAEALADDDRPAPPTNRKTQATTKGQQLTHEH